MSSSFKWKMGELQYTHMFRTFTLRTKRNTCICIYMYMWSRFDVVASSERIILIALAGKHIWLFLWWKGVSYKTTNVSKENDDNAFVHFIYEEMMMTTIINSFTVCLLCLSENHHHHYNHYSTLIIFKREPSAMQMCMSLNTC